MDDVADEEEVEEEEDLRASKMSRVDVRIKEKSNLLRLSCSGSCPCLRL